MSRYLVSPCCGAAVLGMVDVTVHPRYREDGTAGPIADSMRHIKYDVERSAAPDPHEAFCAECGGSVDVKHECETPWVHE